MIDVVLGYIGVMRMPRNQVDLCILCMEAPCKCVELNAPKKAARKLPAPKESGTTASVVETPVVRAVPSPPVPPRRTGLLATTQTRQAAQDRDVSDTEERNALTILCRSGLIAWEDIEKHQHQLNMTPQESRLLIWKQKRRAMTRR